MKGSRTMANPTKRYRLTVPEEDKTVQKFLDCQGNYSISIRMLIRNYISKHGYTDVTCLDVDVVPKRGRPSNAELELRRAMINESDNNLNEAQEMPQTPVQLVERVSEPKKPVKTAAPKVPTEHVKEPEKPVVKPVVKSVETESVPTEDAGSMLTSILGFDI